MKKIELIIEKSDGLLQGRVEGKGWMPTPYGETINEVKDNLKELVADYITNEGGDDKYWNNIDWNEVKIEVKYDLQAFFESHDYLKINAIAERADMNKSLLRQYATGAKHPSIDQVKKIETAVHELGEEMTEVELIA